MSEPRGSLPPSHAWVLRARRLLDESAEQFDGATLSRLNQARQAALEPLDASRRTRTDWLRALGAGAVAAGIALVVWRGVAAPEDPAAATAALPPAVAVQEAAVSSPVAAPDFELLADGDDYAVIEDLEFYAWLQQAEESQGG